MTRWSACIEMLFTKEHPYFPERISAARNAENDGVKLPASSGDLPVFLAIEGVLAALRRGLPLALRAVVRQPEPDRVSSLAFIKDELERAR